MAPEALTEENLGCEDIHIANVHDQREQVEHATEVVAKIPPDQEQDGQVSVQRTEPTLVETKRGRRSLYDRLLLRKRQENPPYPTERTISHEFNAGFWSILTFQWMAPLMAVSKLSLCACFLSVSLRLQHFN